MLEIEKPTIRAEEGNEDGSYRKFVVEPLERGYGTTLGNSLRRVLLSSIPGAAVTTIEIEGVQHQFDTVPGVVEDVAEIIMNLKDLVLRVHSTEPQRVRLEIEGEGEVTGADLKLPADVDLLNPDVHIATLDHRARLYMEMTVRQGRGYVPAPENKEEGQHIGVIAVDSIFSPVRRVNFAVENTRVGQITDYDRLVLEVWTNGSITADEAVGLAAKVIREHLALFVGLTEGPEEEPEIMVEPEEEERNRFLERSIEELGLSVRSFNCLKRADIDSIGELVALTPEEVLKIRNLGEKSLEEITEKLEEHEMQLADSESE
ncbi:MAG: DNA-directed RNA polymerase subunit alpha [Bacillota bacterium]